MIKNKTWIEEDTSAVLESEAGGKVNWNKLADCGLVSCRKLANCPLSFLSSSPKLFVIGSLECDNSSFLLAVLYGSLLRSLMMEKDGLHQSKSKELPREKSRCHFLGPDGQYCLIYSSPADCSIGHLANALSFLRSCLSVLTTETLKMACHT